MGKVCYKLKKECWTAMFYLPSCMTVNDIHFPQWSEDLRQEKCTSTDEYWEYHRLSMWATRKF